MCFTKTSIASSENHCGCFELKNICFLPILAFSLAEVTNQERMSCALQNSTMSKGTVKLISPLFAKIITGTSFPFGNVTLSRRSASH